MTKRQQLDPLTEALSDRLPELRRQRGWTQADLAAFLQANGLPKWTRTQINSFESGIRGLNPTEWFVLLQVLRIGERDLLPAGVELASGFVWGPGGLMEILKHVEKPKEIDEQRLRAFELRLAERPDGKH